MGKIRVDGRTMSLSHPTRLAMYEELLNAEEMSTVMLQKSTGVTRYHLYHHLQSLEKNGLVENHRNEGRARWWRVTERVTLTRLPQAMIGYPISLPKFSPCWNPGLECTTSQYHPVAMSRLRRKRWIQLRRCTVLKKRQSHSCQMAY